MLFRILLLLFISTEIWAAQIDWNSYLRAGTGSNLKGGRQECVSNTGASAGNEFRLGNECGIYGEFSFGAALQKAEKEDDPFWSLKSTFAFSVNNKTDWEATTNNWVLRELYTEGGNIDGLKFTTWIGKRFWRWGDVHMMDYYPVNMGGPGGGIMGKSSSWGKWSATLIQNASSDEINGTSGVNTSVKDAAKTSLHFRLDESEMNFGKWSFWAAGALTPSTASGATSYKQSSGFFFAAKLNQDLALGSHEVGLAVGSSVLSSMSSQGELVKDCALSTDSACMVPSSSRIRFWDSITVAEGVRWSGQLALAFDELTRGTSTGNKLRWTSVGIQPIYWFTDHLALAFGVGASQVLDESDGFGTRNFLRLSIAPEITFKKSYWGRPVLRAYYALNSWNEALRSKYSSVTPASDRNSAASDLQLHSLGLQTEVWF